MSIILIIYCSGNQYDDHAFVRSTKWSFTWSVRALVSLPSLLSSLVSKLRHITCTTIQNWWSSGLKKIVSSRMIIFVTCIPHICHFFSTYTIFGSIFSTQMCVNRYKTDYSKNSVNCQKTDFTTRNRVNFRFLHICIVEKFEIPPNLAKFLISPHLFCENLKFCYIWRNLRFQHICHVLKSEIPLHDQFFIHLY